MWRQRRPPDDEFRDEIEAHVAIETDRLIAEGVSPGEAAAKARRAFGNITRVREVFYESQRFMWFEDLCHDVRFTLRSLRRSPGFAAVAILTLAIGLGANTAIFSVVNAVLLRPLPYAKPDQLVLVEHPSLAGSPGWLTTAWRARARSLENIAGFTAPEPATLLARGEPMQAEAAEVTANFFPLLGVSPAAGRLFAEGDARAGSTPVAVVTHSFWLRQFGGRPSVLGQTITLTGVAGSETSVIVGVLGQDFRFPTALPTERTVFFVETQPDIIRLARNDAWLSVIARLSPASPPQAASAELQGIFKQEGSAHYSPSLVERPWAATALHDRLIGDTRPRLLLLMAAVGCVLLVVCANIANLLLARASTRQAEYAVRAALGAGTGRLTRLVLTESFLLAAIGAVAALLLAYATGGVTRSMLAERVSHVGAIPIDWWVLTFTAVLAAAMGLLSGVASITAVRSRGLVGSFNSGGGRSMTSRMPLRRSLLAAEVAVTFVLVVTAALLSQTLWNLYHSKRGFDAARILTAGVMPNMSGTIPEVQHLTSAFFSNLTGQISALPGVDSAAAASTVPFDGPTMAMSGVAVVGRPANPIGGESVSVAAVTPGYFATMGTRLVAGRDFGPGDVDGRERVAIVNDALRRRIAPSQPLVGAQISFGRRPSTVTVIGVVEDTPDSSLREPAHALVYTPLAQTVGGSFAFGRLTIVARTKTANPAALIPAMRHAVWALGNDIVIDKVVTMNGRLAAAVRTERNSALLFGLLASIALIVAVAGVYAAVAYSVVQRTQEIGIRIALGATRQQVVSEVVRSSAWPVAIGIAIGLVGAILSTRAVTSMLFGIQPTDPPTFVTTALVLALTAVLAAWIPARRAARVNPVVALRSE